MTRYRERLEAGDFASPAKPGTSSPTNPARADDGFDGLTVAELKDRAEAMGLPVSGTKGELIDRLRGTA